MTLRAVAQEPLPDLRSVETGDMISFIGSGASWYTITRRDENGLWGIFETIWTDPNNPNSEKFVCGYDQFPNALDPVKVKLS